MKLLCPTDFSNTSVNACLWATKFLNSLGGGELELLHCINLSSRSPIFLNKDDLLKEYAEKDLNQLLAELKSAGPKVRFGWKIIKSDPKSFVPSYIKQADFDMIVLGSKGMTALKEMTVGSVTAHLMDRIHLPLIVIPPDVDFQKIETIVLGVDEKPDTEEALRPLVQLVKKTRAQLELVHTYKETAGVEPANLSVHVPLDHLSYKFTNVPQGKSVPLTLMDFSVSKGADLLVLLHEHRTWWQRLFVNSLSRTELFDLRRPLMLLPE